MSNSSNGHTTPAAFYDELAHSTPVVRALEALGEAPRGWSKAASAAKAASWRVRATFPDSFSRSLTQDRDGAAATLAEAEARFADADKPTLKREMGNYVENCRQLLAAAQSLVDACPTEAERVNLRREREQRKSALVRLREELNAHRLQNRPAPEDTVNALADLADAVAADEAAQEKEFNERSALQADAASLQRDALDILSNALGNAIADCADVVKGILTKRQVAIVREYPAMADPQIGKQMKRAHLLRQIARDLNGMEFDVDRTFGAALSEDQFKAWCALVYPLATKLRGIATRSAAGQSK